LLWKNGTFSAPGSVSKGRGAKVQTTKRSETKVEWTDVNPDEAVEYTGGAASVFGEESWKWLLLHPLAAEQE